jgi:putative tryptophan/tyrosine transport system substrate-binding protein
MKRREFIAGLCVAAAWPSALRAQQQPLFGRRLPNIGILNYASAQDALVNEFRAALKELGLAEGQSFSLTYRWADGNFERLPGLVNEMLASKVDVIIALGPATWAAKRATSSVPIIVAFSGDPVGNGVVSNLAHPGGNITGFSYMSTDLAAKRLELISRAFSKNARTAVLYNPDEPATALEMRETEIAAKAIGVALHPLMARRPDDLDGCFEAAVSGRADAIIVFTHGFAVLNRHRIIEQAARRRIPTMYGWREFVADGGLMSYGPNVSMMVRQAASYVDRILKGEKPGDLPVQQPTKIELSINLRTARGQGIELPATLLAGADEVIE